MGVVHLRPDELAARWRGAISEKTLANWRSIGYGPKYLKLGNRVVYPLADIERWETAQSRSPAERQAG